MSETTVVTIDERKPVAPRQRQARLTVVESVYHQPIEGEPTVSNSQYGRWLQSDEAPFLRPRFTVGSEWQPLELGWLAGERIGEMVLENHAATFEKNPEPAERLAADARFLEVAWLTFADVLPDQEPLFAIPPGETARLPNPNVSRLRVRCRGGKTTCTLTLYPG